MNNKLIALIILFSAVFVKMAAAPVEIYPGISIETTGQDVTFQEVPEMGQGKYLCLWDGKDLKGIIAASHDKDDKDLKSFVKFTDKGMRAQGAKKSKWSDAVPLGDGSKPAVHRYDVTYSLDGADQKQIYYVVKSATGYFSVIVSITDQTAYESIRNRCDQMLSAVILK